jgi:hypothetical protein
MLQAICLTEFSHAAADDEVGAAAPIVGAQNAEPSEC